MEKLVSSWCDGKTLPESYIYPPGIRPGNQIFPTSNTVPVIDLSKAEGETHKNTVEQIIEAAAEFGFFQVINHGVPTESMDDAQTMFKEFFELPAEQKSGLLSWDIKQKCALFTSNVDYHREEIHNWRDTLRHICTPLEESMQYWPLQPTRYREVVGEYSIKVAELGSRILELIGEGLGLEPGYFAKGLSQKQVMMVHNYPPCPDPSLTLGTRQHCDTGLITILLQGNVPGLQVFKDGQWIGIEAIPDALVVNVGHPLQMVSNGRLTSAEHRAVTNNKETRITAAFFIAPTDDSMVEPAKAIVNAENPAIYKGVTYEGFLKSFRQAYAGEIGHVLQPFLIKP